MSKNTKQNEPAGLQASYGPAYVIPVHSVSYMEGKLLTIIETMGLKEVQEKAVKDLVRQAIWNSIMNESVYIDTNKHNLIREENKRVDVCSPIPSVPRG